MLASVPNWVMGYALVFAVGAAWYTLTRTFPIGQMRWCERCHHRNTSHDPHVGHLFTRGGCTEIACDCPKMEWYDPPE